MKNLFQEIKFLTFFKIFYTILWHDKELNFGYFVNLKFCSLFDIIICIYKKQKFIYKILNIDSFHFS